MWEVGDQSLSKKEGAEDIDTVLPVKVIDRHILQRRVLGNTSVVDENVKLEVLARALHHLADCKMSVI